MHSTHSGQRSATRLIRPLLITLIVVLVVGVLLAVSACGGGSSIVGKWVDSTGYEFEFTADGKFVADDTEGLNMTYVVEGNEITFTSDFGGGITIGYSLDGDTLRIDDPVTGEPETATRVK